MASESRRMLNRRSFLRGAGMLAAGGLLAACAPAAPAGQAQPASSGGEAAVPAAEGKTISFWVFWGSPGAIADQLLADPALESYIGAGNGARWFHWMTISRPAM